LLASLVTWVQSALADRSTSEIVWMFVGILGQILFASRWVVQWISSEKQKRSIIPVLFWFVSIAGGGVSLAYAIYLESVGFILGQLGGLAVYFRNVWLIYRHPHREIEIPIEDQAYQEEEEALKAAKAK
jgi:lipid-A-disaccharide synthase-like uncharacterized protein